MDGNTAEQAKTRAGKKMTESAVATPESAKSQSPVPHSDPNPHRTDSSSEPKSKQNTATSGLNALLHRKNAPSPVEGDVIGKTLPDDNITVPVQNIRNFKEVVVNTGRLLKVFNEQVEELSKTKIEISKCRDEARRMHTAYQKLQRDIESKTRELTESKAEAESAHATLVLREKALSRVHGEKEDLEAKLAELKTIEPVVDQKAPPESPNVKLLEEIERLKKEVQEKEGSIMSLKRSCNSIRSNTKAEIISIQARYAREQSELIDKHEKEMAEYRRSFATKEAELEQEQERIIQIEMDVNIRSAQLEEGMTEAKKALEDIQEKYNATLKELETLKTSSKQESKQRNSDHRSEVARLQRVIKKDEKRISDLETALSKSKEQLKEASKAKPKHKPRSTATAKDAIFAATEYVTDMSIEELRTEVVQLRVDAVHKDETIRKLGVMVDELERKQDPEGRRPRGRVAALQTELDNLKSELDTRNKKITALEAALHISEDKGSRESENSSLAGTIAQLDLKVIALEKDIQERDTRISALEHDLIEAKEATSERPMRLRHSAITRSNDKQVPERIITPSTELTQSIIPVNKNRQRSRGTARSYPQNEMLYSEIAMLRTKVARLEKEKRGLQEIVTRQQVEIIDLREARDRGPTPEGPHETELAEVPSLTTQSSQGSSHIGVSSAASPRKDSNPASIPLPILPTAQKRNRSNTEDDRHNVSTQNKRQKATDRETLSTLKSSNSQQTSPNNQLVSQTKKTVLQNTQAPKGESCTQIASDPTERLLKDKRINTASRAKRFISLLQNGPANLNAALLRMRETIPDLDHVEVVKLIISILALESKKNTDKCLVYTRENQTSGTDRMHPLIDYFVGAEVAVRLPIGMRAKEMNIVTSLWIYSYRHDKSKFFSDLLALMARNIIWRGKQPVPAICSLSRIFSALCFLSKDIQRLRALLCDLLIEAVDEIHTLPVISNCLNIWPLALRSQSCNTSQDNSQETTDSSTDDDGRTMQACSSFSLIIRAFQAVASGVYDLYSEQHGKEAADAMYSIMITRCQWHPPSEAEFADKVFIEVNDTLKAVDKSSPEYPAIQCAWSLLAPYVPEFSEKKAL